MAKAKGPAKIKMPKSGLKGSTAKQTKGSKAPKSKGGKLY